MVEEELEIVELLDIIDHEDKVVGAAERETVYKEGKWHRGVQAIILNSAGELLLCMRSPKKKYFPNTYDCSISEHVKSNETYLDAAIRGLTEEVGIKNVELEPLLKFNLHKEPHENAMFILYAGRHDGELKGSEEEVQTVHFLPLEKIKEMEEKEPQLFSPWTREILRWYCGLPSLVEVIVNYKVPAASESAVPKAEAAPLVENPLQTAPSGPVNNELPIEVVTAEAVTPAAPPEVSKEPIKMEVPRELRTEPPRELEFPKELPAEDPARKEEFPTQNIKKPEEGTSASQPKIEESPAKILA